MGVIGVQLLNPQRSRSFPVNANIAPTRQMDWLLLILVVCLACSWFLMSSLTTDLGFTQLQFRFYHLLALIRTPRLFFTGADGDVTPLDIRLFAVVCALVIVAALAPLYSKHRLAWLGCFAPFVLMVVVGAIVYHITSQPTFADDGSYGATGTTLIKFANSVVGDVGGMFAHQVHVGAGAIIAPLAALILAIKGVLLARRNREPLTMLTTI